MDIKELNEFDKCNGRRCRPESGADVVHCGLKCDEGFRDG